MNESIARVLTPRLLAVSGGILTLLLFVVGYVSAWYAYRNEFNSDAALQAAVIIDAIDHHSLRPDDLTSLLAPTNRAANSSGIDITLEDRTALPGQQRLYTANIPKEIAEQLPGLDDLLFPQLSYTRNFTAGEHRWRITCRGTRAYHADAVSLAFMLILPIGVVITWLGYVALRQHEQFRGDLEAKVRERTYLLMRSKEEWELTFDTVPDMIMILDREQRITRVNLAQAERMGVTPAELIGKPCSFVCHGAETSTVCSYRSLLQDGKEHRVESCLPGLQGTFLITTTPLRDKEGNHMGSVRVAHDISDILEARHRLEEEQRFLHSLMDTIPDQVFYKDLEGKYLGCNEAFAGTYLGRSKDEIVGRDDFDLVGDPELAERFRQKDREALAADQPRANEELVTLSSGQEIVLETIKAPFCDDAGHTKGLIGVARDVTRRRQNEQAILAYQQELETLNLSLKQRIDEQVAQSRAKDLVVMQQEKLAAIGQLAAGVAHEINTPLGYVSGNVDTLNRYFGTMNRYLAALEALARETSAEQVPALARQFNMAYILEDTPELIAESLEGVHRVARLVDELKRFSQVGTLENIETDVIGCLESTLSVLTYELKGVAVVREYEAMPPVLCNPGELNQVLLNLLLNACHAVAASGRITLRCRYQDNFVQIAIADNGHGIPDDLKEKIFEPFFTTRDVGQGRGLGLSLASSIITKHGGELQVESSVGLGTTVTINLPYESVA